MKRKLFSILCIVLFLTLPIAYAAEMPAEKPDELDTGESIAVNVKSYEPTIFTSNLIEDNDIPVYAYLAGSTLGTAIGSEYNVEPVYGGIEIEKMRIDPLDIDTKDALVGSVRWSKPNTFTTDSLGYLMMTLKQIPVEEDVPEEFNLSFTAEIWFNEAERLYSLSKTGLVLPEDSDEDAWAESLQKYGAIYSFFGGRGLVRVDDIEGSTVDLTVYDNKDLYWPIIGAPRAIADLSLKEGETSDYLNLGLTDEEALKNAKFRVTVTDIKDPSLERATVEVQIKGKLSQVIVTEGSPLYPGSSWTVKSISYGRTTKDAAQEYTLEIKDKKGNKKTITTTVGAGLSSEENAYLNKKFYSATEKDKNPGQFYYAAATKSIQGVHLDELGTFFKQNYDVAIDVSELSGDDTKTNTLTIQSGMTLKAILIALLPPGYYYDAESEDTVAVKRFVSVDPCASVQVYDEDQIASIAIDPTYAYDNDVRLNMLCTSVSTLHALTENYKEEEIDGVSVVDKAYDSIAKDYFAIALMDSLSADEKRGAKEKQFEAYQTLAERESTLVDVNVQKELTDLQAELFGDADYGTTSIDDNGQSVFVELLDVNILDESQLSSAELSVGGVTKMYALGDSIFTGGLTDEGGTYNWDLTGVEDEYVILKKAYSVVKSSTKAREPSERISVGDREKISDSYVLVKDTDTKKEAHITITPGTGGALRSASNFSIHIPIEKRAIDLNPEKIDDRIEKAKKLQETIQKLSDSLEKILKYWTTACLAVFAVVTLKSSFGKIDGDVRHDAVYGLDDDSGWAAYCKENSGYGKKNGYSTYDECMLANADAIQGDIEKAQAAKEYADTHNYTQEEWYQKMTEGYGGTLDVCKKYLGGDAFLDDESLKNIAYYNALKNEGAFSSVNGDVDQAIEVYTGKDNTELQRREAACAAVETAFDSGSYDSYLKSFESDEKQLADKEKEVARGVFDSVYDSYQVVDDPRIFDTKNFPALTPEIFAYADIDMNIVGDFYPGATKTTGTVLLSNGKKSVQRFTYNDYKVDLEKIKTKLEEKQKTLQDDVEKDTSKQPELDTVTRYLSLVDADLAKFDPVNGIYRQQSGDIEAKEGGKFYFDNEGTIYLGTEAYSTGELREDYAEGSKFLVYGSGAEKGLPYGVPYKKGNWIQIRSYTQNNEIDEIWYWNVGSDGQLDTNDDVLVAHESELFYQTASPSYERLYSFANKWVKDHDQLVEGHQIEIDSHTFVVSYGKSKATLEGATSSCFDVMNPADCKAMFNVCDPVMCPPSRFNLGGRWQVDNVVDSGLIGSLVLGAGNGDALPVCLTGIHASLDYWNSMLEGYVQCLESAKYEGKSVGICDKVRNVYMCELIVREAAAIMGSSNGGLLDFLANKAYSFSGGGGEYLHFKKNLQEMENAVSYFTTEYATTAFASFKGRTLQEVGTEICQQAIYAKAPWFKDFMNQVTKPEAPTQFYATVVSKPYAPSQGLAAYSLYYHIYAGDNANIPEVTYSVFLRNSVTGEVSYMTEECGGASASIELTEMTDTNLDCTAPEELDQVCVQINGETQCGFGSVGTAFSGQFLKDAIVADEAQKNIDSEEECYPSVSTASPSVSSVATLGATESLVLPYTYGALTTGIQRVCSIDSPGTGQGNTADWEKVGTCGEDEQGRSLGYCWMNTESLTIRDAKKNEEVNTYLKEVSTELESGLSEGDLWDADMSAAGYQSYVKTLADSGPSCDGLLSAIPQFRDLEKRTLSSDYAAVSEFQIGNAIADVPDACGLSGRTEIDYDVSLTEAGESTSFGKENLIPVQKSVGTLVVELKHLLKDEKPMGDFECTEDEATSGEWECVLDVLVTSASFKEMYTLTVEREGDDYTQTFTLYAPESTTAAEETTTEEAAAVCSDVCGWLDTKCTTADECLEQGSDCYWTDGIFRNTCNACEEIDEAGLTANEKCNKLSDSQTQCEEADCTSQFLKSGTCEWDSTAKDNDKPCVFKSATKKTSSAKCAATGGSDAYENAFLDAIAAFEGGRGGYASVIGDDTFDIAQCSEGHPYTWDRALFSGEPSNAAGRYQFIYSTYKALKDGDYSCSYTNIFPDFCEDAQDEAALCLLEAKGITSADIKKAYDSGDALSRQWKTVIDAAAKEWAAFPYSKTNCPTSDCGNGNSYYESDVNHAVSATDIVAVFEECYQEHTAE